MSYMSQYLRVDPRTEKPVVEEIQKHLPRDIAVPIQKPLTPQHYRLDCMQGYDHPLEIERHHYQLLCIAEDSIEIDAFAHNRQAPGKQYTPMELEFFSNVFRRPEVEWAIDNSFDGVYIHRVDDHASLASIYRFAVYLKEEQITFWKLKHHGRRGS